MKLKKFLLLPCAVVVILGGYVYMRQSTNLTSLKKEKNNYSKKTKQQQSGMNLSELRNQNFSSVIGTWTNSAGETLVVKEKGILEINQAGQARIEQKIYGASNSASSGGQSYHIESKMEDGVLKASMGSEVLSTAPSASTLVPFWFIPRGVDVKKVTGMTFNGESDQSQDRIFMGQQFDERNIYVRQKVLDRNDTTTSESALPKINGPLTFASGAGGWRTTLQLSTDGQFSGEYLASAMGDTAEDYPHGTSQNAIFSGKFNRIRRVNDTTYQMNFEQMKLANPVGKTEISNGIKKTWVRPYGMDNPDEFTLYLPNQKISDLPANFWQDKSGRTWNTALKTQNKLNCYALVNQSTGYTFLSPVVNDGN
ncbi:MAG: DUF6287 domain-containing protein [Leuconostoc citreum]